MSTSSIALDGGRDIPFGEGTGTPVNPKYEVASRSPEKPTK
jgi:hypothetical protein